MATFYEEMQEIATELLTEFQQGAVKVIKQIPGSGPPYDPGESTPDPKTAIGVAKGVSKKYVDGTNILQSDMQVTLAVSSDFVPEMTDKIETDGKQRELIAIKPIPPIGTPVVNVIIFR